MLPLRDNQASRRFTPVNLALIAANLAAYIYEISLGGAGAQFIYGYAMVPARISAALGAGRYHARAAESPAAALETLLTSIFLHGGLMHIAGNMLYLFIFGAAVEEAVGHARYFGFFLVAGIAASLATVAIAPYSEVPVIGASGAIAGVLGAYFVLYPRAKVSTGIPMVARYDIPAVVYLFIWFALQIWSASADTVQGGGGVAWWSHVGGFLFGMALGPMLTLGGAAPAWTPVVHLRYPYAR